MVLATLVLTACEGSFADGYDVGFVWNRYADWTVRPDGDHGTTNGNPDDDQLGNPVWGCEYFDDVPDGSDLDSGQPWYERASTAMVWDREFWGTGGRWVTADNTNPCIARTFMSHSQCDWQHDPYEYFYDRVPVVRWINPCNDGITVSIVSGDPYYFAVAWAGDHQPGEPGPMAVDVVIAKVDASAGNQISLLFSETVTKPSNDWSTEWLSLRPLSLPDVPLDPGDEILFSARARTRYHFSSGGRNISFRDDVSITIIPEPAAVLLMCVAGVAVLLKRRRS